MRRAEVPLRQTGGLSFKLFQLMLRLLKAMADAGVTLSRGPMRWPVTLHRELELCAGLPFRQKF
jgi:hypothetical protein